MSKIETSVTIRVYADIDYHYDVMVGDVLYLDYVEGNKVHLARIGFGSVEEMVAVAKAMLRAAELNDERTN